MDDMELLKEYAAQESEQAFATLVSRHIDLVYSVALRHTRNPDHAQEITQAVFIILAKKAAALGKETVLSGWLFHTARLTAHNFRRAEIRRAQREQEAYMESLAPESDDTVWKNVAPYLDEAIAGLVEKDRNAVVLRFIKGKNLREVGEAMGTGEDTARMRVNRALEKMRKFFTKRGVALSGSVLATLISAHSVQAAPFALASSITAASVVKGATVGSSTLALVKGTMKVMTWLKIKAAVAVGAAVLVTTTVVTVSVARNSEKTRPNQEVTLPLLVINNAPLGDAIRNLARQAQINVLIDPNVPGSTFSPDRPTNQPMVNIRWEKVTARAALKALLEQHNLKMVENPATSIARIAPVNSNPRLATADQAGTGSNPQPRLVITDAPLGDVIKTLARQAQINIVLEAQVPGSTWGPGRKASQPIININWKNVTARAALAELIAATKFTMVMNPATEVVRIGPVDLNLKPVAADQVGPSDEIMPSIVIEEAPLANAITNLARQAGLNVSIDSRVTSPPFSDLGTVSVHWERITARQALAALLDNYGLVMTVEPATSTARITFK